MIVFDLDGTLADIAHRRHFVTREMNRGPGWKPQWDSFFNACIDDEPIGEMISLFQSLWKEPRRLEIWSGRSDKVRWLTHDWLTEFVFYGTAQWLDPHSSFFVRLRMRPDGDYTPDAVLKERWLDEALNAGEVINFVVDDRQRVVDMWRRRGVLCLQCAAGDY